MIRINQRYALFTCIYTLVSLILYFSLNLVNGKEYLLAIRIIGFITIIQVILTFLVYIMMKIDFFSLSGSFTWLNYLFHLSQPIIKAVSPTYDFNFDVSLYVFPDAFIESLKYSFLMVIMVSSGILMFKCFENETVQKQYKLSKLSTESLFKIGALIFTLTFPIEAYIQLSKVLVANNSGYLATYDISISGIIGFITNFSLVGIITMILGSRDDFKRGSTIMVLYSIFYVITMFSGGRMWQVIKLLLVFYYYMKTYNIKVTKRNLTILMILGYFGAGFMSAVADFRSYDFQNNSAVFQIIKDVSINNPIFNIIEEFGGSIYTVALTIQKTAFEIPFSMGRQFLANFVSILPNLNEAFTRINLESNFVLLLNTQALGGSFVGEMYYSFHYLATVPAFLIGVLIQFITNRIERGLKNNDYHFIIYSILLQYSFVSWVRGSSAIFYRNTIFGVIAVYIITTFFIRENDSIRIK